MEPKEKIEIKDLPITKQDILLAESCLVDNGIEADEVSVVLQAIGYILLDVELYK